MKKLLGVLFLSLLLVGCGANASSSDVSLDSVVAALESGGAVLEQDKPMFSLLGATDGVILYRDGKPVKVYEFDSEKAIKEAEKALPALKDWERNGMLILETSDDESIKIFKSVK